MMQIFDTHTHVFPEKIAAQAIASLREKAQGLPAYTGGSKGELEEQARAYGTTGMMNCPVVTNPGQMQSVNNWVASWNAWPHLSMGGIHPDAADVLGEIRRIRDLGLYGAKFHPEYQEFMPLEERLSGIWELCQELSLPVLFHAGSDIGFQGPVHSRPADFAELARRYPALKIICAHMGGWCNWDEVERDLAGHPVYLDTSFSVRYMSDRRQFRRLVEQHGADRILFGTDSPWQHLGEARADIEELGLPEENLRQIFWDNAAKLFSLPDVSDSEQT